MKNTFLKNKDLKNNINDVLHKKVKLNSILTFE